MCASHGHANCLPLSSEHVRTELVDTTGGSRDRISDVADGAKHGGEQELEGAEPDGASDVFVPPGLAVHRQRTGYAQDRQGFGRYEWLYEAHDQNHSR